MTEWPELIKKSEKIFKSLNIGGRIKPEDKCVEIGFMEIARKDVKVAESIHIDASETIRCMEIALEDILDRKVKIRIKDLLPSDKILIREIRGHQHYDKLTQIEGRVKSKSHVREKIVCARYECPSCGNLINVLVIDDKVKEPTQCGCGRKGKFRLLLDALEKCDTFIVSLQEPEDLVKVGSDLQTLTCIFMNDLCEFKKEQQIYQGCRVILNGVVKQVLLRDKYGNIKAVVDHFFLVNHVQNIEGDFSNIDIEPKDIKKIEKLAADKDCLHKITESVFSPIHGYDNVKQALILSMFGGNTFIEKKLKNRGLIHVLLIGDPGAGKSDLMLLAQKHHPKASYINVAGSSTTDAGLNSNVERDPLTNEWTFSAGAVPMMHKGELFIDEINELQNPQALQESLEQMTITVRKANIQATLKAETTIVGSCNPKTGRFDPFLNIYEQIDMPPQLVNRFDLIFPFKDVRNADRDTLIAGAILGRHAEAESKKEVKVDVDPDLLKKWIIHAQKFKPIMPQEVRKYMTEKYVAIRNKSSENQDQRYKPVPISPRQLQAMIRVAQAKAKVLLQKKITKEIAKYAVELVISSLELIGIDPETGEIDIQSIEGSLTASRRGKTLLIRQMFYDTPEWEIEGLQKKAEEKGVTESELDEILENLKKVGEIFEPRGGFYKRL